MLTVAGTDIYAPDDSKLFHIDEFFIRPGDRVALLGHNGVGKTTFIKRLMQVYSSANGDAAIRFHPHCRIGYYDQELETLTLPHSLIDTLRDHCDGAESDLRQALIQAGFSYMDHTKKIGLLSGGERARLLFLIHKIHRPNFLILDEPTNHIDIEGKEALEAQLLASNATVLITSHDRRFVDHVANRYMLIAMQRLIEINAPDSFYYGQKLVGQDIAAKTRDPKTSVAAPAVEPEPLNDDRRLQRLLELEALLQADLARKATHQKPALQQKWRAEIAKLYAELT